MASEVPVAFLRDYQRVIDSVVRYQLVALSRLIISRACCFLSGLPLLRSIIPLIFYSLTCLSADSSVYPPGTLALPQNNKSATASVAVETESLGKLAACCDHHCPRNSPKFQRNREYQRVGSRRVDFVVGASLG